MVGWFGLGVFWLVFLGLVCLFEFGFGLGFFYGICQLLKLEMFFKSRDTYLI